MLPLKQLKMSPEIGSSEAGAERNESDGADYLLSNSKYHDWFLTVGNPESDEVEVIGVASIYLVSNSPVFRNMLEKPEQTDNSDSNIHITDVSPSTFKLMLRYLYEGELPKMRAIEAAGLALCADKYKIHRLVQKALLQLNPTSAEDVYPALICVSYLSFPELKLKVVKIIQEETDRIVQSSDFIELDEDCVIFILKQNTLNIGELEIWKNVVRWAENQVKMNPYRTLRDCLANIVGYVRFLTFTSEEIVEYVLPTKGLSPEDSVDLILAVTKKHVLESSALCKIREKRNLYKGESVSDEPEDKAKDAISVLQNKPKSENFNKACFFKASKYYTVPSKSKLVNGSTINIKPSEPIEIVSFTCLGRHYKPTIIYKPSTIKYKFTCEISVTRTDKDKPRGDILEVIRIEDVGGEEIVLPIKLKSGHRLVLNPDEMWTFLLEFDSPHPVFKLKEYISTEGLLGSRTEKHDKTLSPLKQDNVTFTYDGPFHVLQVDYKLQ